MIARRRLSKGETDLYAGTELTGPTGSEAAHRRRDPVLRRPPGHQSPQRRESMSTEPLDRSETFPRNHRRAPAFHPDRSQSRLPAPALPSAAEALALAALLLVERPRPCVRRNPWLPQSPQGRVPLASLSLSQPGPVKRIGIPGRVGSLSERRRQIRHMLRGAHRGSSSELACSRSLRKLARFPPQ